MANSIDELKSYREVVDHFKQARRKINLLLGNGFSIAYDRGAVLRTAVPPASLAAENNDNN